MSAKERTGHRDLTYSQWHREESLRAYFVDRRAAHICGLVDVDCLEYCRHCYEPLALIETAKMAKLGRPKEARATAALAKRASIGAYSLSYVVGPDERIAHFAMRQLHPTPLRAEAVHLTPKEWANFLLRLREAHWPCTVATYSIDWAAEYQGPFGVAS